MAARAAPTVASVPMETGAGKPRALMGSVSKVPRTVLDSDKDPLQVSSRSRRPVQSSLHYLRLGTVRSAALGHRGSAAPPLFARYPHAVRSRINGGKSVRPRCHGPG